MSLRLKNDSQMWGWEEYYMENILAPAGDSGPAAE